MNARYRIAFLDRDGVINRKLPEGAFVSRWEDFDLLPGVAHAIARLNQAGFLVLVVSNQRGISLGKYTARDVSAIHQQLQSELNKNHAHIDAFYVCPHDNGQCDCRKPLPGLFLQAKAEFPQIEWDASLIIGDARADVQAGKALGMFTIFVNARGENQKPGWQEAAAQADMVVSSLPDAIEAVLDARLP